MQLDVRNKEAVFKWGFTVPNNRKQHFSCQKDISPSVSLNISWLMPTICSLQSSVSFQKWKKVAPN